VQFCFDLRHAPFDNADLAPAIVGVKRTLAIDLQASIENTAQDALAISGAVG
jgi:hypothetical protein